ncbi:MAG: DUF4282 domain-containing protein [Dermatophilus congolensis]|nr:DUF4282 domain-containing protein [Dermatophilus congolensis]
MTDRHTGAPGPRPEDRARRHTERKVAPPVDDRIGNRLPVWGSSADAPTGPIDLHANPSEFELAYSGGWGAPGHVDATGPIPRLGRTADTHAAPATPVTPEAQPASTPTAPAAPTTQPAASAPTSDDTVQGLPADTATRWHSRSPLPGDVDPFGGAARPASESAAGRHPATDDVEAPGRWHSPTSEHFVYSKHPTAPGPTTRGFPVVESTRSGQFAARSDAPAGTGDAPLLTGLTDFAFRSRATRVLAPIVYGLLITLLVIAYVANVYTSAMAAATTGAGITAVLITSLVGLVAVAFGIVAGRMVIELACNVCDLASRRDR